MENAVIDLWCNDRHTMKNKTTTNQYNYMGKIFSQINMYTFLQSFTYVLKV